uniref:Uncharacterized protein n=1 Tax=Anguilla anguilla TaxID=7936 RepID=A0A0E9W2K0_ANGAN
MYYIINKTDIAPRADNARTTRCRLVRR